jgi:hypothetical protein
MTMAVKRRSVVRPSSIPGLSPDLVSLLLDDDTAPDSADPFLRWDYSAADLIRLRKQFAPELRALAQSRGQVWRFDPTLDEGARNE